MSDPTVAVLCHFPRDVYRALSATADRLTLSDPLHPVQVHTLVEVAVCRSVRGETETARLNEEALRQIPDNAPPGLTPEVARAIRIGRSQFHSDREIAERIGTFTQATITRYRGLLGLPPVRPRTGGGRRKAES